MGITFCFFLLIGRILVKLSEILKLKCYLNSWARKIVLIPFAASFITNRIFSKSNVYTMYTLCIYLLIFEFDFFSLSLLSTDFLGAITKERPISLDSGVDMCYPGYERNEFLGYFDRGD